MAEPVSRQESAARSSIDRRLGRRAFGRTAAAAVPVALGGAVGSSLVFASTAEAAVTSWLLTGNAGTLPATNFLGTTDNKPLIMRTNDQERVRILGGNGFAGFGTVNPQAKIHALTTAGTAGLYQLTATTGPKPALKATTRSGDGAALRADNLSSGDLKGAAIQGYAGSGSDAQVHPSGTYWDAAGEFSGLNGLIGAAGPGVADGYGVIGLANNSIGVGVYASGTGGAKALIANGNADVYGTLTKGGGSFKIDHPLAPADKYLSHSFVESPDMMNVYNGVVTADASGSATVTLPDWFQALNRDFRYQLTAIGAPAPDLHVLHTVRNNRFGIAGATAGGQVSWQLTGIRRDRWADANRIPVEQDKPSRERGSYLHPQLYGAPEGVQVGGQRRR